MEFKQTETFRRWRMRLKDLRVRALIASRLDRLAYGNAGDVRPVGQGISELRIATAQVSAFTSKNEARPSSSCCAGETRAHRPGTSKQRSVWRRNGAKKMAKKTVREKLTPYDPAEDLESDEAVAVFMAEAFQTNDAGYIAHALGVVARAKGMAQIASQTGLSREQLYRSFSEKGNPTLKTTLAVMDALGVKLTAKIPTAA